MSRVGFLVGLLVCCSSVAWAQCFKVTATSLNLRALPSTSGMSLGTVSQGQILTWMKKDSADGKWALIRTSAGIQAWVFKNYLSSTQCSSNKPNSGSPESSSACGPYDKAPRFIIAGNGGVKYTVVRIVPGDLSRAGAQDNTMTVPTACGFYRLKMAARAAGHRITINSAFRTLARQQYFWNCYRTRRCNGGALAARPGTSNHGRGQALDFALTGGALSWMNRNAQRFGFVRTVRSETWHWEYIPGARKPFPY